MTGKSVRRVYRLIDLILSSANDYIKCVFAVAVVLTWSIFPTRPLTSVPPTRDGLYSVQARMLSAASWKKGMQVVPRPFIVFNQYKTLRKMTCFTVAATLGGPLDRPSTQQRGHLTQGAPGMSSRPICFIYTAVNSVLLVLLHV